MSVATIPEIKMGEWTFAEERGGGDPALSYSGIECRAGSALGATELRKAALDLMKLAAAVAAAGF